MINNDIILNGVMKSGLSGFCLMLVLFNINNFSTVYQKLTSFLLLSLTLQFILLVIYLTLYKKLEVEYKSIYFLSFLFNISTFTIYTYYIVINKDTGTIFLIFLIYSILTLYWIITLLKKECKRGVYRLIGVEKECSICFDEILEKGAELMCKHVYHKECIDKWLLNNSTCPYCRAEIV